MADKQISQLVAATTINNDDLFVMQQGGTAKKLSGQKLSDFVYQSAADQIERVNEAVEQTQAAVDSLEEQKNEIAQTIADMAQLGTDTTLTTPGMAADAAATGEVKAVALARFEQKEITGVPIATFDDGADDVPVKKLIVGIEPVQSGSGDPSPDNVRPITGWTGANVKRTGKNLLPDINVKTLNGITATKNSDGSVTLNGTATATTTFEGDLGVFLWDGITPCWLSGCPSGGDSSTKYGLRVGTSGGDNYSMYDQGSGRALANRQGNIVGKRIQVTIVIRNGFVCNNLVFKPMLEFGTSGTEYESYKGGTTYPITFPSEAGTVYGGTLDVTNGVLTVDRAYINVDDTYDWLEGGSVTSDGTHRYYVSLSTLGAVEDHAISDKYKLKSYPSRGDSQRGEAFYISSDSIQVTTAVAASAADFKTWLSNNGGLSVVYTLAAPTTYILTPTVVRTLLALNNIWADTGNILDLIYRKEPITEGEIQEQIDTIRSAIATAEDSGVASTNYSIGALILVGSNLVEVTSPIAQGESIVIGSNCQETTVAAQIAYLKSIVDGIGNLAYLSYEIV